MSRNSALTTTSYAILGLLAVQPLSTYELARQMDRTLGRIWPRAQSKVYEEPKKLVRRGLADAVSEPVGRRPRTVYNITPQGRQALAKWLQEPGAGPVLESEQILKVFFAGSGTAADTLAVLHAARTWAVERNQENLADARANLADDAHFPEHVAQTMLVGRFLTEYHQLVATWADWATRIAEQWPNDPSDAVPDRNEMTETLRRAEWSTGTAVPDTHGPTHEGEAH